MRLHCRCRGQRSSFTTPILVLKTFQAANLQARRPSVAQSSRSAQQPGALAPLRQDGCVSLGCRPHLVHSSSAARPLVLCATKLYPTTLQRQSRRPLRHRTATATVPTCIDDADRREASGPEAIYRNDPKLRRIGVLLGVSDWKDVQRLIRCACGGHQPQTPFVI